MEIDERIDLAKVLIARREEIDAQLAVCSAASHCRSGSRNAANAAR